MIQQKRLTLFLFYLFLLITLSSCAAKVSPNRNEAISADSLWTREELYFGMDIQSGGVVSEQDWNEFVSTDITPRFPDGITILNGTGQYKYANGTIAIEPTKIVIIYFKEHAEEHDKAIDAIIESYKQRFHQESVLRSVSKSLVKFQ